MRILATKPSSRTLVRVRELNTLRVGSSISFTGATHSGCCCLVAIPHDIRVILECLGAMKDAYKGKAETLEYNCKVQRIRWLTRSLTGLPSAVIEISDRRFPSLSLLS